MRVPVVGGLKDRVQRQVEEHSSVFAWALTALTLYGAYRGFKWWRSGRAPVFGGQADFAEEYDVSDDGLGSVGGINDGYTGLPGVEEVDTVQSRRGRNRIPVVQDANPRKASAQSQASYSSGSDDSYGDDFGSEVVADFEVGSADDSAGDDYSDVGGSPGDDYEV